MKILYVIHQFYPEASSGTERFLLHLATSVQRSGNHADVLTYSFEDKRLFQRSGELLFREYMFKNLEVTAIRHERIPSDINTATSDSAIFAFATEKLNRGQYDLVHLAHPMRLAACAGAAEHVGIPYVLTLTDFWSMCPKITLRTSFETLCTGPEGGEMCARLCPELDSESIKSRLRKARQILDGASAVVCPSQFAARLVQAEFSGIAVSIVPHGLEITNAPLRAPSDPAAKLAFAYCGGLSPHKGVHLLVSAFRSLDSANAELRIYGSASAADKSYERNLRKLAGYDHRIRFCGSYKEEELAEVFGELDVLVIPSLWYETYSFTLHEAFACNVPVIASDIGVLREKVADSVTGFTFPMGDEAALARVLKRVIEAPSVLTAIRQNICNLDFPLQEEEAWLYERIYRKVRSDAGAKRVS